MNKRYRLTLLAGILSVILAAGSISMPVQAGIFDKIKQSVDEASKKIPVEENGDISEIVFLNNEMSDYVEGSNGVRAEWTFSRLLIDDDQHDELNAALKKHSDLNMELVQDAALEIAEEFGGIPDENTYLYYSILANRVRTDSLVLSFWEKENSFDGYGYYDEYIGYNFDSRSGKKLRLKEVVQDHIELERDLPQIIGMAIEEIHDINDFDQDIIDDDLIRYLSETFEDWYPHLEWTLDYEGITFLIPEQTLSLYESSFMITVHFSDFADFVRPEYTDISLESLDMLHENFMNLTAQKFWVYPEEEGASLYAKAEMELLRSDYSYELSSALFSRMDKDYQVYSDEFLKLAEENKSRLGKDGWELKYTVKDRHRRADNKVLSFVRSKNVYTSSDGYYIYENRGYNYDPVTGIELRLGNILKDKEIFAEALKNGVRIELENGFEEEEYKDGLENLLTDIKNGTLDACTDDFSWSVGYEGMLIYIDSSLLFKDGQYPMTVSAFVPFKGNEEAFDKKYLRVPETYTVKVLSFKNQSHGAGYEHMDLDGDGLPEELFLDVGNYTGTDKYTARIAVHPWSDEVEPVFIEKEVITEEDIQELNAYLVKIQSGGCYLFLSFRFQDDYRTYVYEMTAKEILSTGCSFEGLVEYSGPDGIYKVIFGNPKDFPIYNYYPLLGTHYAYKNAALNQELAYPDDPLNGDGYLHFDSYNGEMTLSRKLSGSVVDFSGESYRDVTVKAGESLRLFRTDETSFIDFLTEEGWIFRIEIEVEPGLEYLYNGRNLEAYFVN